MDDKTFELIMNRFDRIEESIHELRADSKGHSRWQWMLQGAIGILGVIIGYAVEVWANK